MGIRDTVLNALENVNIARATGHSLVQNCDSRLVQLRVQLQKAQTERAGADMIRETADREYRELLKYSGSRTDQNERNSLSHEVEWLAQEVNTATRNVLVADDALRQCHARIAEVERDPAVTQDEFRFSYRGVVADS